MDKRVNRVYENLLDTIEKCVWTIVSAMLCAVFHTNFVISMLFTLLLVYVISNHLTIQRFFFVMFLCSGVFFMTYKSFLLIL